MADVFDDMFDGIGADFDELCAGQKPVTVEQVDADTGAARTTVEGVAALKRARKRADGDTVPSDTCRFVLRAGALGWTPAARDRITDYDGVIWDVESAELIGFGALVAVSCVKNRG